MAGYYNTFWDSLEKEEIDSSLYFSIFIEYLGRDYILNLDYQDT